MPNEDKKMAITESVKKRNKGKICECGRRYFTRFEKCPDCMFKEVHPDKHRKLVEEGILR